MPEGSYPISPTRFGAAVPIRILPLGNLPERRYSRRYPIRRPLRYRILDPDAGEWVESESLNIGSAGLAFRSVEDLRPGTPVGVSVSWPVLLNGLQPIRLAVTGPVIWCAGGITAVRIEAHEFRTAPVPRG